MPLTKKKVPWCPCPFKNEAPDLPEMCVFMLFYVGKLQNKIYKGHYFLQETFIINGISFTEMYKKRAGSFLNDLGAVTTVRGIQYMCMLLSTFS